MNQGNLLQDRSNASLSGSSQTLLPEEAARRLLIIHNPNATNSIAVNMTGGTAALNTAGSITIPAGKMVQFDEWVPTNAITVIGTSGEDVTCYTNYA